MSEARPLRVLALDHDQLATHAQFSTPEWLPLSDHEPGREQRNALLRLALDLGAYREFDMHAAPEDVFAVWRSGGDHSAELRRSLFPGDMFIDGDIITVFCVFGVDQLPGLPPPPRPPGQPREPVGVSLGNDGAA